MFISRSRQGKAKYLIIEKFSMFVYWININKSLTKIPDVKENAKEHLTCSHEIKLPCYVSQLGWSTLIFNSQLSLVSYMLHGTGNDDIFLNCQAFLFSVFCIFYIQVFFQYSVYKCLQSNNGCRLIGRDRESNPLHRRKFD